MSLLRERLETHPGDVEAMWLLAQAMMQHGRCWNAWNEEGPAIEWLSRSVEVYGTLRTLAPHDFAIARDEAATIHLLGYVLSIYGHDGAPHQRDVRRRLFEMLEERPWSVSLRRLLAYTNGRLALDYAAAGEHEAAAEASAESVAIAGDLAAEDPHSVILHRVHSVMKSWLADVWEYRAADESRSLDDRFESVRVALAARHEAMASVLEREERGWLFGHESHYPDRERAALVRVQRLIDDLEAERAAGAANAQ